MRECPRCERKSVTKWRWLGSKHCRYWRRWCRYACGWEQEYGRRHDDADAPPDPETQEACMTLETAPESISGARRTL